MKKSQTSTPQNERDQASQGGAKRGSQGGRSGGEASRSSSQQQQQPAEQPKGSKQSVRPGGSSSQGLTGAQGSGGGAERGMQQAPDSLDRDD